MVRQIFTYILVFNLYLINSLVYAQNKVESITKLPGTINSEAEEILPLLSPGGDSLFFARVFHESNVGGKYSGSDIWVSLYDQTKNWLPSSNQLNRWNDKRSNFIIGMNSREQIIYQNNAKNPEKGIQFVKKLNGDWTKPENISIEGIPNTGYQGIYVSTDYNVILLAMKSDNGYGKEDLYVSTKNSQGNWTAPVNLGSTINSSESEISPFLSSDKKTLFFSSQGHGGYGDMDIFMSERLYNSWTVWSKPKNLGDKINSSEFDGYYSNYGDSLAFFSSNREGKLSDIYEARFRKIEEQKSRTMPLADASTMSQRIYLDQQEIEEIFGFSTLQPIEIEPNSSISESSIARELIYFLSNKFMVNKEVKLGIKVSAHPSISTEQMVKKASDIASFIATEMNKNGISSKRIEYEGVDIENQSPLNDLIFRVSFVFFK